MPADLPFFEGHFPGTPILPGVVALTWMLSAAERFLDAPLPCPTQLVNLKFQLGVLPGQQVELTVAFHGSESRRLVARLTSGNGVHASVIIEALEHGAPA